MSENINTDDQLDEGCPENLQEESSNSIQINENIEGSEEGPSDVSNDMGWMARTGLNFDGLCGAIEAIIFMCDRPISLIKIKKYIDEDIPLKILHQSIERLQHDYEKKHHGIRLIEVAEGYQFRTKATYSRLIHDLFRVKTLNLTPSALWLPFSYGASTKSRPWPMLNDRDQLVSV